MRKTIYITILSIMLPASLLAQEAASKASVEIHGFIRNYYAFDTRSCVAGTDDFFTYLPKDENVVSDDDLNAQNSFRFAALTSRLWVEAKGYEFEGYKIGARVEADFYNGLSGSTGAASFRMRQAFVTVAKDDRSWKMGQAWHPMAADMPDVFSINTGSPFGPFSRTPLVQVDYKLGGVTFTGAAIWQMQYASCGPSGTTADYIKYSCTPELYLGASYGFDGGVARFGVDVSSITPRIRNSAGTKRVNERITTAAPFFYVQYVKGSFIAKFKTVYAQDGSHLSLNGGYAICGGSDDEGYEYTPTRNSSSWVSLSYGKKWQGVLFGGYAKNFGTAEAVSGALGIPSGYYFYKNSFSNMNSMWRVTPAVIRNLGKLQLGLEYELTGVSYGDKTQGMNLENGLYEQGLHNVTNHRVQALVKFTF